jgi:uncharacterized protein (TIGR02186 family)
MERLVPIRLCALTIATMIISLLAGTAGLGPLSAPYASAQTTAQEKKQEKQRKQKKDRRPQPAPAADPEPPQAVAPKAQPSEPPSAAASQAAPLPREKVEADVSTRSIAVTSGFTGTEIIVFGSVDHSRQPSAEAGYYDVAVVVEGGAAPLIARRKSNVAGLWVNTASAAFTSVPSYYAITSTRPLEEIADAAILEQNAIGLDNVRLTPAAAANELTAAELKDYRAAVVRLKEKEELFVRDDYGVAFIGRSLFRSSVELPPNVPVGPLTAHVYLFREGELLSTFTTAVKLEREGVELLLYHFAMNYPLLYGIFAVVVAVGAGLLASTGFRRMPR